ncbi:MAG: diacylglycerol kinase family lipid kinase [Termitinemataceae bacterium]|nr:MAG: diacylglycerol kinase family lipid kinase [Termitinemataceae bacterium]
MERNHLVIINKHSFYNGKTRMFSVISEFENTFKSFNIDKYEIKLSKKPRHALSLIHTYVDNLSEERIVRVYAVGGDGILFDCLNGIMGLPNMELAAVPYGKTNDYVRSFGESNEHSFKSIPEQIIAGTIPVDVINYRANYALNFCCIGVETVTYMIAQRFLKKLGVLRKFLARFCHLAVGLFVTLSKTDITNQFYEVNIDDKVFCKNFSVIHIANGSRYGGKFSVVTDAKTTDGLLDVITGESLKGIKYIIMLNDYLHGKYFKHSGFSLYCAKTIKINSESPLYIMLDGEVFTDTEAVIKIMPKAVNFVNVRGLTA